jgi:UDP-N-acetylmuramoyl-tripeptide--D-alanyl-D-alanine ligase
VLFERNLPSLFNIFAWVRIIMANERTLRQPYQYEYAVLELGTDGPGQIERFAYLQPDIAVVTALTAEHIEFLKDVDGVAREELQVARYARQLLINIDDSPPQYLEELTYKSYGFDEHASYRIVAAEADGLTSQRLTVQAPQATFSIEAKLAGTQGAKVVTAAVGVADLLGMPAQDITVAAATAQPFAGRMQILAGLMSSTIIDDSYNSSPVAAKAALDVLYAAQTPQRIAILGNMNELGDYSPQAHEEVGDYCDPEKLDVVITIGTDANKYLAPHAEARGCQVHRFDNPYAAGDYIASILQPAAVILAKGSQNGVFAEEVIKSLLQNPSDQTKLVRQSPAWLESKRKAFTS